jgi:hypothetical protein
VSSQSFTSASGTFTAPVAGLTLRAIGGGGAGGGATGNPSAGGGGAGGQFAKQAVTVEPGDELSILVGQAVTGTTNSTVAGNPTSILPRNWATTANGASISVASGGTFDGAIGNLIDGVGSSYWMSDSHFGDSISVVIDLGSSRRVRSFGYLDATDDHACTHFRILAGNVGPEGGYSDAVQVYDSGTRAGGVTRVDLASAVTARYWIWVAATDGSGGNSGSGTQIYLWELYGASVAVNCVAMGGAGAPSNSGSGAAGSASGGQGDVVHAGGNGSNRVSTSSSGGGGGAAGEAGAGGNASGTTAGVGTSPGGNGAAGRTSGNVAGNAGVEPGGGGGGARAATSTDRAGGNGARGQAWIDWLYFGVTVKGRDVYLDASSLPGTITDYHWEFGDGVESAGAQVDHTYLGQATAFTVTLTVTYDDDSTDVFEEDVTVGAAIYVASDGTSGGDGSIGDPYDIHSVFDGAHTGAVGAGGTVWLRGGTYDVATIIGGEDPVLQIWVEGAAGNPCVVRPVPGEHVIIDGPVLQRGQYSEFRGDGWIEMLHSDPEAGGAFSGYALNAVGGRGINLVIHDAPKSGTFLKEATAGDELLDGLINYNNGTSAGFDHGIYTWNPSAFARAIRGALNFGNWGFGLHCYSETEGQLHDLEFDACWGWVNGGIDTDSYHQDLIVSGTGATDITVTRCRSWHPDDDTDPYTAWIGDTGATPANDGLVHTDNYWVGAVQVASDWTDKTESGNTTIDPGDLPTSGQLVTVRPSPEVGGYGQVLIYNWANGATCDVDVSGILAPGDSYEVLHAHDLFGTPVASGTWDGSSELTLPMTAVPLPTPTGTTRSTYTRENPGTLFHAFIVRRTAQSYGTPSLATVAAVHAAWVTPAVSPSAAVSASVAALARAWVLPAVAVVAAVSASVSAVAPAWVIPVVTPTMAVSATVSAVAPAWVVPGVQPTGAVSASASAVESTWVVPAVVPQATVAASASAVQSAWQIPVVSPSTAVSATAAAVEAPWVVPAITPTLEGSVSVAPVVATWVVPTVTPATAVSAAVSPVASAWHVPAVTPAVAIAASVTSVAAGWVVPAVTPSTTVSASVSAVAAAWHVPTASAFAGEREALRATCLSGPALVAECRSQPVLITDCLSGPALVAASMEG